MEARQRLESFVDVGKRACEVLFVELTLERAVKFERVMKIGHDAVVVDDVPELLAGMESINPRNGLQEGVLLQASGDIEDNVPGRVETGKQLIHHDDDFGIIPVFESV